MTPAARSVAALFALSGWLSGSFYTRLPAIKAHLDINAGRLSLALLGLTAGLVAAQPVTAWLVARRGSGPVAVGAGLAACAAVICPGLAGSLGALIAVAVLLGMTSGSLDTAMNVHGVAVERGLERPILSRLHATYSLGVLAGSGAGGAMAAAGLGVRPHLIGAGLVGAAAVLAARPRLGAGEPPRAGYRPGGPGGVPAGGKRAPDGGRAAGAGGGAAGAYRPGGPGSDPAGGKRAPDGGGAAGAGGGAAGAYRPGGPAGDPPGGQRRLSDGGRRLVAGGAIAFCVLLCEGAVSDWSAVHLRDTLHLSSGAAALGLAGFSVAMITGRLAGDRVTAALGTARHLRVGGTIAGAGLVLAALAPDGALAILGFTAAGIGLSALFPLVIRAASATANPAAAIAAVTTAGYAGLVTGPPAVGALASVTSLRASLALILGILCVVTVLLAPTARR